MQKPTSELQAMVEKDVEESTDNEKNSGSARKLRQSRLPFKALGTNVENPSLATSGESPKSSKLNRKQTPSTESKCTELKKRRHSETSESDRNGAEVAHSKSDKCPLAVSKKPKTSVSNSVLSAINTANEVVIISSSSDSNDDPPTQTTARNTTSYSGAGTPPFCQPISANSGDTKMLKKNLKTSVKLNFGNKKKRRRTASSSLKSEKKLTAPLVPLAKGTTSEETELISENELNPQKRSKIGNHEKSMESTQIPSTRSPQDDAIRRSSGENASENISCKNVGNENECKHNITATLSKTKAVATESELELETSDKCDESSTGANYNSKESSEDIEIINEAKIPVESLQQSESNSILNLKKKSKKLSEKQKMLIQQRHAAREEKERKLEEQKLQRQLEKKNKELIKKKEREAKEQKRLAELEVKNEEKRKKLEAKEEELRKKEDERRRKEIEKEEAEIKKKKAAEAFTKFFVNKIVIKGASTNSVGSARTADIHSEYGLAFQPFEIKGDMQLAPVLRKTFTEDAHAKLDECLSMRSENTDQTTSKEIASSSYLAELQSGKIEPYKWKRQLNETKADCTALGDNELGEVGVVIIGDTLNAGQQRMRAKFYKFHDNRRPPYYGTWSKSSDIIKPRRPFAQDKEYFDYDVDSNDEWEEDEPGESLEGSDNDKESEDDDYEVDNEWFVPHGHLSEEEMQNEDDFANNENTHEAQKFKLQMLQQEFAQEMKKKTEKIKPRLIGCIWVDENGNPPSDCYKLILETLQTHAIICSNPITFDNVDATQKFETNKLKTDSKLKSVVLSEDLISKLISLVHGNQNSKKFLIKEFCAYVKQMKDNIYDQNTFPFLQTAIRKKFDEIAEWQVLVDDSAVKPEAEQKLLSGVTPTKPAIASNISSKKKKSKKKLCWMIQQHILDEFGLSDLSAKNSWNYILQTKHNTPASNPSISKNVNHALEVNDAVPEAPAVCSVDKTKCSKSIASMFKKLPFSNPE